ncbi:hypothetical protein LY76DRAFT_251229 [Colletotrichum caudatum]|nr:hypothetical protein LY76DRAFT_251229 [Colletotrichum caudatum]
MRWPRPVWGLAGINLVAALDGPDQHQAMRRPTADCSDDDTGEVGCFSTTTPTFPDSSCSLPVPGVYYKVTGPTKRTPRHDERGEQPPSYPLSYDEALPLVSIRDKLAPVLLMKWWVTLFSLRRPFAADKAHRRRRRRCLASEPTADVNAPRHA